jgi:CheY-like chemotaxis protein
VTVLLAEDDIDDQELLEEAFKEIDPGIRICSFTSGRQFLQYLDSLPDSSIPDLIVLDYNIPEVSGADILRHVDETPRYRAVVKLVWSTSSASLFEKTCMSLGARAYLVKPSNISGLIEMAKKMLSYVHVE